MSEVIESYIRRNPDLSERDAFEGFLREERIKAWVGTDEARKERLRKEFGRVWGAVHVTGQVAGGAAPPTARAGPSGPSAIGGGRAVRVQVPSEESDRVVAQVPVGAPTAATPHGGGVAAMGGGRRLQVLCASCKRIEVWMGDDQSIACRRCGHQYDDMLHLIRVTPVGPFEFLFGEGWQGAAVAGGIALGLVGLYFLLRGF